MDYSYFHLVFFIFFLPLYALAQNNGKVAIGSIVTANEISSPWLSPSSDFAFGFQKIRDQNLFLLSIWYYKIPDKTIVWYVNSINPVPQGSTVKLDPQKGIVLRDPQGLELWNSAGFYGQVDHGFLNDTGNFVLLGSDNTLLWESFRFPTDTILPTQELKQGDFLSSRKSETSFSQGRFYLRFLYDGNLVLATRSVPTNVDDDAVYYNSQTYDPTNSLNSGYLVVFDYRGSFYILKRNNETKQLSPPSIPLALENYHRIKLEFDGVLIHYYHPTTFQGNNQTWRTLWSIPDNICTDLYADKGNSACGLNSICSIVYHRPVCECPEGFTLLDPSDKYGSCTINYTPSCYNANKKRSAGAEDLLEIDDIDWPGSDYQLIRPSNVIVCRVSCLNDCFCAVAVFRDNSCWKKRLPLSNGKIDTTLNSKVFVKYNKG